MLLIDCVIPYLNIIQRKGARLITLLLLFTTVNLLANAGIGSTFKADYLRKDSVTNIKQVPVKFTLKEAGYVSLVIEDLSEFRVRNLISEKWFPAGNNTIWWDGTNDLARDPSAYKQGIYHIPANFVEPGKYKVRGVFRKSISTKLEFSVYAPGNPPWSTADHTGGWLANHTPPKAAQFIPAAASPTGKPVVLLGSFVTEGPDGLAWVNLDGNKQGGLKWIGGAWTGAPFITSDNGKNAIKGTAAYIATPWDIGIHTKNYQVRLTALAPAAGTYQAKQIGKYPLGTYTDDEWQTAFGGFAVHDGIAAFGFFLKNQVLFVNLRDSSAHHTIEINKPKGLAFDATGRLLVLSGKKLLRYKSAEAAQSGAQPEVLNTKNIEEPYAVTTDKQGLIYVSDRGSSHTIKVFSTNGALLRLIGTPGPPAAGPYNPLHINNPAGITIDENQYLWVTEEDYLPKRVSVWSLDGKLIKAFYGPGKYGGGGTIDGNDKSRFYYADNDKGAMEFTLDWQKGESVLKRVFYRPTASDLNIGRSAAPETAIYYHNKRYFTNAYNSSPIAGNNIAFLFVERNGIAVPAVAMGAVSYFPVLKEARFKPYWPQGVDLLAKKATPLFFIWQDLNANGLVEPNEVAFSKASVLGVSVMPDLTFCIAYLNEQSISFNPQGLSPLGIPLYDITRFNLVANHALPPASSGGGQLLAANDGWNILTLGILPYTGYTISGTKDGQLRWTYPNLWPGLHASHLARDTGGLGEVIGATRLLGGMVQLKDPQVPALWAINGNHGNVYLFTNDGIFVSTLFKSNKNSASWNTIKNHARNMGLDSLSLGEENFWPTITKTNDDKVYLVDGGRSAIVRLDGVETIRRLPESYVEITQANIAQARQQVASKTALLKKAATTLPVSLNHAAPVVDGKLMDWNTAAWATIYQQGNKNVTAALSVSNGKLYIAYRTGEANLLVNSGEMPTAPFKTGGALDVMIGTSASADSNRVNPVSGDCRLLISIVNGKTLALLYKAVVPGTRAADQVPFSSPSATVTFDKVIDISNQIQFAAISGNYEVAVPLALIGITAQNGLHIKGDLGILRGQAGQTISRTYWSNKATGTVSDVPSEAKLTPANWGTFVFKQ